MMQVLPSEEDIECHEIYPHRGICARAAVPCSTLKKREGRPPLIIKRRDLPIDNHTIGDLQISQLGEGPKQVESAPGSSTNRPVHGSDDRSIAVPLDLEPPILIVKGGRPLGCQHGLELGQPQPPASSSLTSLLTRAPSRSLP